MFIWLTRISNILGDDERSTGFKIVHVVLAAISVAFALAIGWIGLRALRPATGGQEHDGVADRAPVEPAPAAGDQEQEHDGVADRAPVEPAPAAGDGE